MALTVATTPKTRSEPIHTSWLSQAACIAALAFFFVAYYSRPFTTGDTMWSNVVGQWMTTHDRIPTHVYGTWTAIGQHWMPQEWGFELLLYSMNHVFGFLGVVVLMSAVSTLTWVVFASVLKREGITYPRAWAFLGGVLSMPWDQIRAETFSYLFVAITLWILGRFHKASTRLILLSLLQVVWVNMHGSFMLEWMITLSYGAMALFPSVNWHWIRHDSSNIPSAMKWFVTSGILMAVSLLNPQGIGLYRFAFWLSFESGVQKYILEWQAATITEWVTVALSLIFVGSLLIRLHTKERLSLLHTIWGVVVFIMFLKSVRFGSYALLFLPWAFAPRTSWTMKPFQWCVSQMKQARNLVPTMQFGVLVGFGVLLSVGLGHVHGTLYQNASTSVSPKAVRIVTRIEHKHPTWHLWNAYNLGGTFETQRVPVSVDGRTEIYLRNGIMSKYASTMAAKPGTIRYLNQQHINLVCLQQTEPLYELLTVLPTWKRVYTGQGYAVFERAEV